MSGASDKPKEGGAKKLIKCEVCGREVWAEQLYEGLCPTCERQMQTESWGGEQ